MPTQKALRLAELGVQTLVCGAIFRHTQAMVEACGIRVIPFVTGELQKVINGWLSDSLENGLFAMPGCHGRRYRRGYECLCRSEQEEYLIKVEIEMDSAHVEGKAEADRDGAEKAALLRVPPSAPACVRNAGSVNRTSVECHAFRNSAPGVGLQ